jgi:hypothetical protein
LNLKRKEKEEKNWKKTSQKYYLFNKYVSKTIKSYKEVCNKNYGTI